MIRKKKCVAMLLAGGQGSRLAPLTSYIAKPAVPFGAKYRIIDFSISNCVNSGIDTVGVLTQYQPLELNDYLGTGKPWDLNVNYGGLHVLPPYQAAKGADWFKGTANAIYQNIKFIKQYDPDYVLILSGDHIYKMDYSIMLEEHIKNQADCTLAVIDVPLEEASRFGIMSTDAEGRVTVTRVLWPLWRSTSGSSIATTTRSTRSCSRRCRPTIRWANIAPTCSSHKPTRPSLSSCLFCCS